MDADDSRTDQELIAAINGGDFSAFDTLYFRYRDWVVNLAFRLTADRDLALDVLQETFLYLARKFPGFVLTCQLRTFLYPAVRNLSINAQRKARRAQGDVVLSDQLIAEDSRPALRLDEIDAVLERLGAEHREVLLLRFVDGLSLNEIAAAMEIPLGTVKSRLHNALHTLRNDERTKTFFQE